MVVETIVVFLLLIGWGVTFLPSYRDCRNDYDSARAEENQRHAEQILPHLFICEGVSAEANNGIITAFATVFMAVFTGTLWFVTNKAVGLARDEFIATHRPRIFVQTVNVLTQGARSRPTPDPARFAVQAVNGGETTCRLTSWCGTIYYQSEDAAFTPNLAHLNVSYDLNRHVIQPGLPDMLVFEQDPVDMEWEDFVNLGGHMFLVGRITYCGIDRIERITGFCREYSKDTGRWHAVKDSEYEYAY